MKRNNPVCLRMLKTHCPQGAVSFGSAASFDQNRITSLRFFLLYSEMMSHFLFGEKRLLSLQIIIEMVWRKFFGRKAICYVLERNAS